MNLVEMLERRWHLPEHDVGVAAVHLADVVAFKCVHEALAMPLDCGLQTGVWTGLMPKSLASECVPLAQKAPPLSLKNSSSMPLSTFASPKRASTPSISMSRTGSPGSPRLDQARQEMISRSQQSFRNTPVTTSPLSQPISKPSEHHRRFDSCTAICAFLR